MTEQVEIGIGSEEKKEVTILSGNDGAFKASEEVQKYLCYMSDGRILVSSTHLYNPLVVSYIALLKKSGAENINVVSTDLEGIRKAYQGSNKKESIDQTHMAKEAIRVIESAFIKRASDIHIRVTATEGTRISFRIHGDICLQEEHVENYGSKLCSTIYNSLTDVSDTAFKPTEHQDARIPSAKIEMNGRLEGVRVATSPVVDGFMMVMRLLYNDANNSHDLQALGWKDTQKYAVNLMKARPTGLNIVCGPTGSGKSTTLQRILSSLIQENSGKINVITVEDPPEYPIPGANQTPVVASGESRAEAFESCIRGAMRLDPDVMMISEVRDSASAQAAIRAAMTGHQVWTTLHANDAVSIIDRLVDIGIPLNLITDHHLMTGLICQRLVKVLCPACSKLLIDNADSVENSLVQRVMRVSKEINSVRIMGEGCKVCNMTGTKGRTAIVEVITPDIKFMELIRNGRKNEAIDYWTKSIGSMTLLKHVISKMDEGLIDPRDAEAATGPLIMDQILEDGRIDQDEMRAIAK